MKLLKDLLREVRLFGGWPFYIIIIVRSLVGSYWAFTIQTSTAFILSLPFKRYDLRLIRSFQIAVFASLFYQDLLFTVFSAIIWLLILYTSKQKLKSTVIAVAIAALSYLAGLLSPG